MACVAENCHPCEAITLSYEWTDSCVIQLPGTVPPSKRPFTEVYTPQNMSWVLTEPPEVCGEDFIGGIWSTPNYDAIELCPEACDAFMVAGEMTVEFGSPPCE